MCFLCTYVVSEESWSLCLVNHSLQLEAKQEAMFNYNIDSCLGISTASTTVDFCQ